MTSRSHAYSQGPFRADQLHSGDEYELSRGHAIRCAPTGGAGSGSNQVGASVVGWDPQVTEVGVDTGYAPAPDMLRAPDVAVGNVPNKPGWVKGAPSLAIEYADVGQDEVALEEKIRDLLAFGTRYLWVVRLTGKRRVEVHEPGKKMQTAYPGEMLTAPGVLKNAVRVEALYDRDEAERATLVNLLQRRGYEDLEAVLAKGREEGRKEGREEGLEKGREKGRREVLVQAVPALLEARGLGVDAATRARIDAAEVRDLERWFQRAASGQVQSTSELFETA
ncbi:MAG: hypothetical protein U0441_06600 [Polyangiaceae bacterium]